jgi:uncharacterized protein (DUF1697 family)
MPQYVAFLRGVSPANAKMTDLKACFEKMGFTNVRILTLQGDEVFTAYIPNERGPIFMTLIEKQFGKHVTTRTWDTVKKCAAI